ncbi:hypothetical protein ABZS95_26705 [Streptomyces sp. NPDC005479]|uniref:hypothetical protein n=1 Tax=Streptomyces sp. NPDC005479 TaxID=3154879 RepID=UPI00339FE2B8
MGKHAPRRARIVFYDVAQEQVERMTDAERVRLDFALAEISADPAIGAVSKHAAYREYARDGVRVLYVPSALGTLVLVAYVEA